MIPRRKLELILAAAAIAHAPLCRAAEFLPLEASAVPAAIKDAAGRIGVDISLAKTSCAESGSNCRYDAGGGVELFVMSQASRKATAIEANWSNGRPASSSSSAVRYVALCRAIIASVEPEWSGARVAAMAAKLTLLRSSPKLTQDVEQRLPAVVFYGSRNVPDMQDFPAEAFVQCGVTANAEEH